MTRSLSLILALLLLAWAVPRPAAAADIREDFVSDPRNSWEWSFNGDWVWNASTHRLSSPMVGQGTAVRQDISSGAGNTYGVLSAWVRLLPDGSPDPARAGVVFGWRSYDIYHAVTLAAGNPGRIILQRRDYGRREVIEWKAAAILPYHWYRIDIDLLNAPIIRIYLTEKGKAPKLAFSPALTQDLFGTFGLQVLHGRAQFDDFILLDAGGPIMSDCEACHGTSGEDVNDWNGRNTTPSKINSVQFSASGHGQTGIGKPNLTCESCHDKTNLHDPSTDLSGPNPFRLIGYGSGSITTPDAFCTLTAGCHTGAAAAVKGHFPASFTKPALRTWPAALPKCWDCHDPHGDRSSLASTDNRSMIQDDLFNQGSSPNGVPVLPTSAQSIIYTVEGGLDTTDDGGSFANTAGAHGLCQKCHTALSPSPIDYFTDGDSTAYLPQHVPDHASSGLDPCTVCHLHTSGFEGSSCEGCHGQNPYDPGGGKPVAPDVVYQGTSYSVWDGTWWDMTQGGSPTAQQGGHGDPAKKAAVACTDCHDISIPIDPATGRTTHLDGIYNSVGDRAVRGNQNENTAHLKANFIAPAGGNDWDVQVQFDLTCGGIEARTGSSCHEINKVTFVNHSPDDFPAPYAVKFGSGLTMKYPLTDSRYPLPFPLPVDSDLTTNASTGGATFAPCVSCHNPHGSTVPDAPAPRSAWSNRMLRGQWQSSPSQLCFTCHK